MKGKWGSMKETLGNKMEMLGNTKEKLGSNWEKWESRKEMLGYSWGWWGSKRERLGSRRVMLENSPGSVGCSLQGNVAHRQVRWVSSLVTWLHLKKKKTFSVPLCQ